jgi:hypothetical protein
MILIEKTTMRRFDDVAERARLKRLRPAEVREGHLAVLDAFVAGDFAQAYKLTLGRGKDWMEYMSEEIYDTLKGVHEQLDRHTRGQELLAAVPPGERLEFGRGTELGEYPKFTVLAEGKEPVQATVLKLLDLKPIIEELDKRDAR